MTSGEALAGPSVAMILVLRCTDLNLTSGVRQPSTAHGPRPEKVPFSPLRHLRPEPLPTLHAMPVPVAIIPLKGFDQAKGRLDLPGSLRSSLAQAVAGHVIAACGDGGLKPLVVTGSEGLREWAAARGAGSLVEPPGGGLNAAAERGVTAAQRLEVPWLVVHGDLPLLDASDLHPLLAPLSHDAVVIAPSRDGGTNLLGSSGQFPFAYGPGSFHRHLAAAAGRDLHVVVSPGTALEIDTLPDLRAATLLPAGAWLRRFLS